MSSPTAPILSNAPRSFNGALEFYWYPPSSPGDSAISSYTIGCTEPTSVGPFSYPVGTNQALVTGLSNGVLYNFSIYATNVNSNIGPEAFFRPFEPGTSAPTAVTTATATASGDSNMLVSWSGATTNDATIYWYTLQTVSSDSNDPVIKRTANGLTQTDLLITGLNPSSVYYTLVRAVNCPGYSLAVSTNTVSWAINYAWTVLTSGPGAKTFNDVSCSADGSVIAVCANNFIMVYNSTTSSWIKPLLAFRNWQSIGVSSDGSLILAAAVTGGTNSALVARSTDYGATWTTVIDISSFWSSVNYSPTGNTYAVATRSATTGTRTIYGSSDGGATWNELVNSGSRVWTNATISDDGQRIAACVGGTTGTDRFVYTSEDGGATWTQRDPSGTSTPLRFTGITGSSDGLKLAVTVGTPALPVADTGFIYTSTDGGVTWTQRDPAGGARSWSSITGSPDGVNLTATIMNGSIWTSTDSGSTWTERTFSTTYDWRACCMTSNGQKIYAVPNVATPTGQNFLQESTNGGSTWTQLYQPGNGGYGITTTGSTRFATSSNGNTVMLTAGSVVYTSTDAGSTFVRRNLPITASTSTSAQLLNNIICDATGQIIYVAPAGVSLVAGVIQKSVDGGANWTGLTASGSRTWNFIRCSSNGQYIYGAINTANSTIYISTDSGDTFTSVVLPVTSAFIRGIECDTTGQIVYATLSNSTTLFKSIDYGATWSSASTLVASGTAIDCNSNGSTILARNTSTVASDYLYISTDSGATFNPITSAGQKLWSAASISGDGTRMVAATSVGIDSSNVITSPGSVWISTDSGMTWTEQTSIPTNERWTGLQISSDGSKIYAGGISMELYRATV